MSTWITAWTWALILLVGLALRGRDVFFDQSGSGEAYAKRTYFYAGGEYVHTTPASSNTAVTHRTGQIYVEKLEPRKVRHEIPVVFIVGNGQTATNWLNTPDGRPGWASIFLENGFVIYLTEQAQRGRSPWLPGEQTEFMLYSTRAVEQQFTAPQDFPSYPQAASHTQWPGSGRIHDPIFDAFYASQVPAQSNATLQATYNNAAYVALIERIGPAIIIAHSQGGPFAWKLADMRPQLVRGIVAIEPEGPPFENYAGVPFDPRYIKPAKNRNRPFGLTLLPLEYDPPIGDDASLLDRAIVDATSDNLSSCILQATPARQLPNLANVPILFVTSEASYHAIYDHCTVAYLRQAGVKVDFIDLPKVGVRGNGHFMFMEKNNREVATQILPWVKQHAKRDRHG